MGVFNNQEKAKKMAAIGPDHFNNTIEVLRDVRSPNMGTLKNGNAAVLPVKPPHRIPKISSKQEQNDIETAIKIIQTP
jgi:hypothetical protein